MLVTFRGCRFSNNTGSDFQIGFRKFITSPVLFLSVPLHSQILPHGGRQSSWLLVTSKKLQRNWLANSASRYSAVIAATLQYLGRRCRLCNVHTTYVFPWKPSRGNLSAEMKTTLKSFLIDKRGASPSRSLTTREQDRHNFVIGNCGCKLCFV